MRLGFGGQPRNARPPATHGGGAGRKTPRRDARKDARDEPGGGKARQEAARASPEPRKARGKKQPGAPGARPESARREARATPLRSAQGSARRGRDAGNKKRRQGCRLPSDSQIDRNHARVIISPCHRSFNTGQIWSIFFQST